VLHQPRREFRRVNPPRASEKIAEKFTGPFERIVLLGVGHFPLRRDDRLGYEEGPRRQL